MTWQQFREEWVRLNVCKFCRGSHMHTCSLYQCQPAIEKAEKYFEKVVSQEEKDMELIRCDLCGKEVRKKVGDKVNIQYGDKGFFHLGRDNFEMDLCPKCTQEIVEKVKENRKRAVGEDGRQQDNE